MILALANIISRRRGGGFNPYSLGLVSEAYAFNNAHSVDKIYYKKTGTAYNIAGYVPLDGKLSSYAVKADTGGFIMCDGIGIGSKTTTYVLDSYNNFDSRTGTWATSAPNYFTREVGATMTFTFVGTGINFYSIGRSDMCGLWGFRIDGGDEVVLSTYRATTGYLNQQIARGLTNSQHTIVGTYKGEDPAHTGGTPTGWCYYGDETTTGCFHVYRSEFGYTSDTSMIPSASVVELALQAIRQGATYTTEWVPYHGVVTTTPISRFVKIDGVEVTNWTADTYLKECKKIEIIASYYTFNSAEPNNYLYRLNTIYTIDKYGYRVEYAAMALQDIIIDKYGYQLTVDRKFATDMVDNNNNAYSLTSNDDVITNMINGDGVRSLKVTSSLTGKTGYQLCSALINPNVLRIGATDRGYANVPHSILVISNLSYTDKNKIYCSTFRNHPMQAGEVFSAEFIYYAGLK